MRLRPMLAVAAALVLVFGSLSFWGVHRRGSVAFAEVLRKVQSSHSVRFKGTTTIQVPGLGAQTATTDVIIVAEPNRMRQTISVGGMVMPGGMVMVWDFREGRCLTLDPQNKRATVMEMSNLPPEQKSANLLDQFWQFNETAGTAIGEKEIAGRMTQGFKVVMGPTMEMLIWADTETRLPVQIETTMKSGMLPAASMTMTDFVWDQEVDESLVSLTPPTGYEVLTFQMNMGPPTEQEMIDALKTAAQLNGGKFPADLSLMAGFANLSKSLKKPKSSQDFAAQLKELEAAMVQDITAIGRAWMFINDPKNGEDFHYAGKGVALGQAGTPILWYRPKGSATYRMIDADLTVRDLAPADLPSVPSTPLRPTTAAAAAQPPQP